MSEPILNTLTQRLDRLEREGLLALPGGSSNKRSRQ